MDLWPVVDQINLDLTSFDQVHFKEQKKYIEQPENMRALLTETAKSLNRHLIDRLFYEKLKTMEVSGDETVMHLYNNDYWSEINLNRPLLYAKLDSQESIKLVSSCNKEALNGVIIKAATMREATDLAKLARSLPGLKNLDLQVEVPITSLDEAKGLKAAGFSKVQIPGSLLVEKVGES